MAGTDKKTITRSRILNYVINNQVTSKVEVSKNLNLSMPTVLSNVNDLIAKGIIIETGEYESTGGRKAKSIGINPSYRYSVGIVITANHVGMVLVNLKPAKLAGVLSEGMLLCAEDAEGNLALMTPEKAMPAGAEIC